MTEKQSPHDLSNVNLVEALTQSTAQMEAQGVVAPPPGQQPMTQAPVAEEPEPEAVEEVEEAPEEVVDPKAIPNSRWRDMRLQAERAQQLERERDEAIQYARSIEAEARRLLQQPLSQQQPEPEYDINSLSDDDIVDGKQIKKIVQQENRKRRQLEENILRQQQQSYEAAISAQLKSTYGDFDNVVTSENVAALRSLRPGLARSLAANPDLAEKARETYHLIKDLGIYQETKERSSNKNVIAKNASKPRASNSIAPQTGDSPLDKVNSFTPGTKPSKEYLKELYADMQRKRMSW